ncbi:MAG: MATE family efflux transporter, partial [Defluviitaleaceae bacterium]|nr:MATE family efflux transporter [Defluviitaleaceae bacterium]
LRGAGQTKIPMIYNLCGNVVHLGLNFLLINGNLGFPALGVEGAAISATFSRIGISIAALCVLLFWKKSPLRVKFWASWKPNFKTAGDIFAIGMPSAGEQFAIQTGLLVYTWMVASLYTYAFTAHQIAINVNGLAFSISMAFAISTTALVGRACGQDDYDLAHRYTIFSRRLARLATAIVTASFIIFSTQIIGIYTEDPIVIQYGVPVFWFMALTQFVQSSNMSTAGALRGSGDTMYPLYASIAGIWGTRLILAATFIFVFRWGVAGAWFAFFIDQCVRSYVVSRRFNSGKWREMKAIREQRAEARRKKLESRN